MTKPEYRIVQAYDSLITDQTDDGKDFDDDYTENINGDQVIVLSANDSADQHFTHKVVDKQPMQTPLTIISLIFIYFTLSIGLTFYQRSLLKGFQFPFAVVLYHSVLKLSVAAVLRLTYKCVTGIPRVHIDLKKSTKKLAPAGIAAGIDIGFSNWGLELVTISLYTMTKSTTIIFILFFAIMFGLEKKSWFLMLIVVLISSGLCLFTYKATQFNMLGFIFVMIASSTSGIRWTFAQFIMQKSKLGLHNPIDMLYFMQPWMILAVLILTIAFEGEKLITLINVPASSDSMSIEFVVLAAEITIGGFIAFAMELSEFLVLSYTSSLTLSIAGIFKEICQLILAVEFNGDQMSTINMLGLVMCLGGIACHIIHKFALTKNVQTISMNGSLPMTSTSNQNQLDTHLKQNVKLNFQSNQRTPLLDSSDECSDNISDDVHQNESEVIFDVLKRRDYRR